MDQQAQDHGDIEKKIQPVNTFVSSLDVCSSFSTLRRNCVCVCDKTKSNISYVKAPCVVGLKEFRPSCKFQTIVLQTNMQATPHMNLCNVGVTTTSTLQFSRLVISTFSFVGISQSSDHG